MDKRTFAASRSVLSWGKSLAGASSPSTATTIWMTWAVGSSSSFDDELDWRTRGETNKKKKNEKSKKKKKKKKKEREMVNWLPFIASLLVNNILPHSPS